MNASPLKLRPAAYFRDFDELRQPANLTWFANEYKKSSKKLDMGKGCVRFKKLEDLALDVVGRTVNRVPVEEHVANYRAARALMSNQKKAKPKK